jgi:hypothetical protein
MVHCPYRLQTELESTRIVCIRGNMAAPKLHVADRYVGITEREVRIMENLYYVIGLGAVAGALFSALGIW